ncbi:MAG: SDR family NAD(P)-dependent oxidoreductase [Pseudomonadota bacterium]
MRALVTGGNRGIGHAIAAGLMEAGLDVVITARAGGAEVAETLGCRAVTMDLCDDTSVAAGLAEAGPIDVLINNAGVLWDDGLFDDADRFETSFAVMVRGPYRLIRATLPHMTAQGYGRVVNVSSGWGSFAEGLGGGGAYGPAKAALNALTLRAAQQAAAGVKINAMCPGWVQTRMGGAAAPRSPEQGADTAIWLATLPQDGPSGGFFRDRQRIDW